MKGNYIFMSKIYEMLNFLFYRIHEVCGVRWSRKLQRPIYPQFLFKDTPYDSCSPNSESMIKRIVPKIILYCIKDSQDMWHFSGGDLGGDPIFLV